MMLTHLKQKGFTLIELLVVIAIIGILSAVVLTSLALARLKGMDAAIKSNVHIVQTNMELYYDNNGGTYGPTTSDTLPPRTTLPAAGTIFNTDTNVRNAMLSALSQSGTFRYAVGPNSYAVAFKLKADSTNWWCLDNTNNNPKTEPDATGPTMGGSGNKLGGGGSAAICP